MATSKGEKTGGRKKGTPNRITKDLIRCLHEHDYDPLVEIIKALKKERPTAEKTLELRRCLELSGIPSDEIEKEVKKYRQEYLSFHEKIKVHQSLLDYIYPKRKAIELKAEEETETPVFTINFNQGAK